MRPAALASRALDLIFPPRCVGCGTFDAFICDTCLSHAPRADGSRCPRCWNILEPQNVEADSACANCRERPLAFLTRRSAFSYGGVVKQAIFALKFHGVSAIAPTMGAFMHETLNAWSPAIDAIVPIPLGTTRKRTRGYNQSELLAKELARRSDLPMATGAVRRARATRPQTEQPDAAARWDNVAGAFAPGKRPVTGSILLIDDVTTTGATLDACARALLESGATHVYALTFARED